MENPAATPTHLELCCLSILLGECAGVVYVLGITALKVLNLW